MIMNDAEVRKEENKITEVSENMFQDNSKDQERDSNWYTTTTTRETSTDDAITNHGEVIPSEKSFESLHNPEDPVKYFSSGFGSVSDDCSSTPPQPTDNGLNSTCTDVLVTSKQSIPSRINSTHSTADETTPAEACRLETLVKAENTTTPQPGSSQVNAQVALCHVSPPSFAVDDALPKEGPKERPQGVPRQRPQRP